MIIELGIRVFNARDYNSSPHLRPTAVRGVQFRADLLDPAADMTAALPEMVKEEMLKRIPMRKLGEKEIKQIVMLLLYLN